MPLIAIDLFSGGGGLTVGLKQAGFKIIGAVDNDPLAVETYQVNHPNVQVWPKDITELSARNVRRELMLCTGELDLLAGCPPCQGFSNMRTLNGKLTVDDPMNDLVYSFMDFVREFQPKAVMLENVPQLANDMRMDNVLSELKALGYFVSPNIVRVLNTVDYGVPQRRRRMILMTSRLGAVPFALPDATCMTVQAAISLLPLPGASGDPLHDVPEERSAEVMERIRRIPKDGGSRRDLGEENQLRCHANFSGFKDVYGRMAWSKPSPTITGGCTNPSKGRFLHPDQDRAITLREAALLQSFPQNYYFSLRRGKNATAVLIGNALPPEFIRRHAEGVASQITQNAR